MNDYEYLTHDRLQADYKRYRRMKKMLRRFAWGLLAAIVAGITIAVVSVIAEPREAVAAPQTARETVIRSISIAAAGVPIETARVLATAEVPEETAAPEPDRECLGTFTLTAYCSCKKCCGKWSGGPTYSGVMPQEGRTIAVDPRVIPLGSRVYIDGYGEFIAEDTGSSIKGNRIDIYMGSHTAARWFADGAGSCRKEVWIIRK